MMTNCLDVSHNTWDDAPITMVAGDSVSISGATEGGKQGCSEDVNASHVISLLELSSNVIFVAPDSFTTGCSRQNVTLNWMGVDYSLSSVDFVDGSTYDEIVLNADIDMQQFIGRQVHSSGTGNLAAKATVQTDNDGVMLTTATSAQNCHRYVDANGNGDGIDAGDQRGWNSVTPWIEP
jgi:hypothetical protein